MTAQAPGLARDRLGRAVGLVVAAIALCCAPAHAQTTAVPAEVQATLLHKTWTFDRNHGDRSGDELVIGVAFQSGFRPSLRARTDIEAEFTQLLSGRSVPIRIVPIEITDPRALLDELYGSRVDVLYVTPLRSISLQTVTRATRALGVLSCTGVPDYVAEGIALGIAIEGGRPRIVVNLEAARAEGAEFRSELLRLARVIQGAP